MSTAMTVTHLVAAIGARPRQAPGDPRFGWMRYHQRDRWHRLLQASRSSDSVLMIECTMYAPVFTPARQG